MYRNRELKETPFALEAPEGILPKEYYREMLLVRAQEILQQIHEKEFDALIFLDKSARPLSWIIKEMWENIYPETPPPKIYFLNIGGKNSTGMSTKFPDKPSPIINKIMRDILTENMPKKWISESALREIKEDHEERTRGDMEKNIIIDSALEQIDPKKSPITQEGQLPKLFIKDAKRIGIIDDFIYSGQAILGTMALIKKHAPNATCEATAFFPAAEKTATIKDRDIMPWIGNKTMIGITDEKQTATNNPFAKRYDHSRVLKNIFREKIKEMTKEFLRKKGSSPLA